MEKVKSALLGIAHLSIGAYFVFNGLNDLFDLGLPTLKGVFAVAGVTVGVMFLTMFLVNSVDIKVETTTKE